ncbi:MAG: di-trans,poly-cis-decaprenylcistransferase [Parcubacteria group bacterium]|nr:di-trans,poly-cis-decaprenylcistransferase [Parcubacteria group bacterium]
MIQDNLPRHVFIIPDGNRRWAMSRHLAPWEGHIQGRERFHEISDTAFECGISYFTFWAASEDNLTKRDPVEISFLTGLLRRELEGNIVEKLFTNHIRLRVLGGWEKIFSDNRFSDCIHSLEEKTAVYKDRHLTILLGYSGKTEIADAAKAVRAASVVNPDDISFETVKRFSWTRSLPSVDLEIRTGEERPGWSHRSSGALPFIATDSAYYHTETLWPDFSKEQFLSVIEQYGAYERRFGA